MNKALLLQVLDRGHSLGIQLPPSADDLVKYLRVRKDKHNIRAIELVGEQSTTVESEIEKMNRPFSVVVVEFHKSLTWREDYGTSDDYKTIYPERFRTIDEVIEYVGRFDKTVSDFKWFSELLHD
jgi:hypothetical protein